MGFYSDYLTAALNPQQLEIERAKQLSAIARIRQRDVLVMAADIGKPRSPISIEPKDLIAVNDQLSNLQGKAIDLILETPGGSGETAEDIVKLLRAKYEHVGVIVPGVAKSAGTIIAMAADEILMEGVSALGPIDAQILWQGKVFSAGALIEKVEKIKQEVIDNGGVLNKAYIPILQSVSPGELQNAENALAFAKTLVRDWLVKYKFKDWKKHNSDDRAVTAEEKIARAAEVATALCDHSHWKTHGRSIHIDDLRGMKLQITDYAEQPELCEAIRRYNALLQLTFDAPIFKLFETPASRILRIDASQAQPGGFPQGLDKLGAITVNVICKSCGTQVPVSARFDKSTPAPAGSRPWPSADQLQCPKCKKTHDLTAMRKQIESQAGKKIIA